MLLPTRILEKRYAVQAELWIAQRKLKELEREIQATQNELVQLENHIRKSRSPRRKLNIPKTLFDKRETLSLNLANSRYIIRKLKNIIDSKRKEWADVELELRHTYRAVGYTAKLPGDVEVLISTNNQSESLDSSKEFVYDAFISHASEDKEAVARPLFQHLRELGVNVWFDEKQLEIGDSLRQSIDQGLVKSKFGIVIISPHFLSKNWTQYELDSLVARELESDKVILPIWHKVSKNEILAYSPKLADKLALHTSIATLEEISLSIALVTSTSQSG